MTEEQTQEEEKNVLAPGTDQDWTDETKGFTAGGKPKADAKTDDKGKADKSDEDAKKAVEGEKESDLPDWMKTRLERSKRKENDATARAAKAEEKAQAALDELAALKAEMKSGKSDKAPAEEPDPDDYDTTADYEKAKRAWKAAQDKKKPEPKKEEPKKDDNKLELPAHIDRDEYNEAEAFLIENLPKETITALSKLHYFPPDIVLAISDLSEGDKAEVKKIAKFAAESEDLLRTYRDLSPRRMYSSFERSYNEFQAKGDDGKKDEKEEKPKSEDKAAKKKADPDPPITRNKGNGAAKGAADADTFKDFESLRNEEERGKTGRAW